jgi:hypothetical protein
MLGLVGLMLLLLGYVAYQKHCWLCDDDERNGEGRDEP